MKYDTEYYIAYEGGDGEFYMIGAADDSGFDSGTLSSWYPAYDEITGIGRYDISEGDKAAFIPTDYHETPDPIVSEKFKAIIESLNPERIEFYPCTITNDIKVWDGYYAMHIWGETPAMDRERSKYETSPSGLSITINKLSLSETVLDEVPLADRLIFRLEEKWMILYHQSVKDALEKAGIDSIRFVSGADWGQGSAFD